MCLILFAYQCDPEYPLVLLANRDEYYARATAPLSHWDDAPDILGGRDLVAGGTWMGLRTNGRFAALTNHRDPASPVGVRSRGALVADFLRGSMGCVEYLSGVASVGSSYSGFNLLVGDGSGLYYFSNRGAGPVAVAAGIHGLSNALLDTPWPKVLRGTAALEQALASSVKPEPDRLLEILQERQIASDSELPDTGVGLEFERMLSPAFITSERYGTRSSSVLTVAASGEVEFVERSHDDSRTRRFTALTGNTAIR
jgi:uncharacterized protein with NRDE domain